MGWISPKATGTKLSSNGADGVAIARKLLYYRDILDPPNSLPTRLPTSSAGVFICKSSVFKSGDETMSESI